MKFLRSRGATIPFYWMYQPRNASRFEGAGHGFAHTWRFKHPSPWDYMFFMSEALDQDLGWFWYYWLFTTGSVDGSIQKVALSGSTTADAERRADR